MNTKARPGWTTLSAEGEAWPGSNVQGGSSDQGEGSNQGKHQVSAQPVGYATPHAQVPWA